MTERLTPPAASPSVRTAADGGRAEVVVRPDQVWPPLKIAEAADPHPGPGPAHQSFLAPIAFVTAVSSALMTAFLAVVGLWLWAER